MLKKAITAAIVLALAGLCACSARSGRSPAETTAPESTSAAQDLVTGLDKEETTQSRATEKPASAGGIKKVIYGKDTGTDKTYTGLEPLPPASFDISAFPTGLSTAPVEHSFGVAKDETPHTISVTAQRLLNENGLDAIVYNNRATTKTLYLTFDCGYDNGQTERILDTLKEKNVKAAFFCTLPEMQAEPELTARMIREGHIVGNHSVSHPDFSALSHEQMLEEVKGFDDWIREHCGYSAQFFRFPMGKYSIDAVASLNAMGFRCVFWSLAYFDWDLDNQPGADEAYETVISRLHPGAVILLHAVSPANAAALPEIIDTAREMGYEFRALNE